MREITDIARHRIMVMSGKGGVGKTTVAVNLSLGLALYGNAVGLLDADITGPNVPKMLKIEEEAFCFEGDQIYPYLLEVGPFGIQVVSMAFMVERDTAVAWKGPLKISMLKQFAKKVEWEDMDYLIVDLPPGTSDEPISIAQLLKPDGAIIVTTPHELSIMDAKRSVEMAKVVGVPVLGLVENMSAIRCPRCGKVIELMGFKNCESVAAELDIPYLGRVEMDPAIAVAGDSGRPFILDTNSSVAKSFETIVRKVIENLG